VRSARTRDPTRNARHCLLRARVPPGLPRVIRQEDGSRDRFEAIFQAIDVDGSKSVSLEEFVEFLVRNCSDRLLSHPSSVPRESNATAAAAPPEAPTSSPAAAERQPSGGAAAAAAAGDVEAAAPAASPVVLRTPTFVSETWLDTRKDMPALRDIGADAAAAAAAAATAAVADSSSFALVLVAERVVGFAPASILSCTTQSALSIVSHHVFTTADTPVVPNDIGLAAGVLLPVNFAAHHDVYLAPQELVPRVPRYLADGTPQLDSSTGVGTERDDATAAGDAPPPPGEPVRATLPPTSTLPAPAGSGVPVSDARHHALVVDGPTEAATTTERATAHDAARAIFEPLDHNGGGVICAAAAAAAAASGAEPPRRTGDAIALIDGSVAAASDAGDWFGTPDDVGDVRAPRRTSAFV
jgi:hypothetical protein